MANLQTENKKLRERVIELEQMLSEQNLEITDLRQVLFSIKVIASKDAHAENDQF